MNPKVEQNLKSKLGEKVSFSKADTLVYDHDIGIMPKIIMSTITPRPEAVVIAKSVEDIRETLRIASEFKVHVTPRGQGSSGYGGAISTKGGILLDLSGMDRILKIDKEKRTVDVEPGVIWNNLSHELLKEGLDNKIYPTSAPSSTVAGWLSKGGVGIGSMKYGSIIDVVEEVEVVGANGDIQTYNGNDIELFHQTCGIMGIITRIRLSCRKAEDIVPFSIEFPNPDAVQNFVLESRRKLEPYTIILNSPGYVKMKKEAKSEETISEEKFLVTLGIESSFVDQEKITSLVSEFGGKILSQSIAEEEWEHRFYPMRIKKLGPDFVVSEFYIPEDKFSLAWKKIEEDLAGDLLGMEALVADKGRIAVLIYILDNAEELLYQVRTAKAVRAIRIAQNYGGALYSSGLWFASSSRKVLGSEKYEKVMQRKKETDPHSLLNPGKIVPPNIKWMPGIDVCSFMTLGAHIMLPLAKVLTYKRSKIKK